MSKDMLGPVTRALVSVPQNRLGIFADLANKVADEERGDDWHSLISQTLRQGLPKGDQVVASTQYLHPISSGQTLTIAPCDGSETLAKATDLFTGWLDANFVNYGTDVSGVATPETPVEVFELIKNARFDQFFPSVSADLDKLYLTQHQTKRFVLDHQIWLHPQGRANFFLFKVGNEFFVANVRRSVVGLGVDVRRFSFDRVWRAGDRHRVVVSQLTA